MAEAKQSFWRTLFSGWDSTEQKRKVLEYVCHRVGDGAHLGDVMQEGTSAATPPPTRSRTSLTTQGSSRSPTRR